MSTWRSIRPGSSAGRRLPSASGAPATAVPPSCKRVSRSGASSPRSARGSRAGGTPDRVQPVPSREQRRSPRRRLVERGIQQLLVGRENDYERERNDGSEKQAGHQHRGTAALERRAERGDEAPDRETRLHDGGTAVAGA